MLRSIFLNWFAARYGSEIRAKFYEAAADAVQEAIREEGNTDGSDGGGGTVPGSGTGGTDLAQQSPRTDVGFVFATGEEYGCLLDLMKNIRTTRGNGLKYYEGTLGKVSVAIVESGIGEAAATEATLAIIQIFRPERILSAGFSGGLRPGLARNTVAIPLEIVQKSTGLKIDLRQSLLPAPGEARKECQNQEQDGEPNEGEEVEKGTKWVPERMAGNQVPQNSESNSDMESNSGSESTANDPFDKRFASGTLVTVDSIASEPEDKKKLGEKFNADLVDMESFAVANVCRKAGVPFLAVRVVLDPVNEKMPSDLKNLTGPARQSTARMLGAFFGTVTRRPSSLVDIYKLKENALVAADTLANAIAFILKSCPGGIPGAPH